MEKSARYYDSKALKHCLGVFFIRILFEILYELKEN